MNRWGIAQCVELVETLDGENAEEAWDAALDLLDEHGITLLTEAVQRAEDDLSLITLESSRRSLAFRASDALEPRVHQLVSGILSNGLRRTEQAIELRRRDEQLQMVSEGSFEGLLVHIGGNVFQVNKKLGELTGFDPDDLLGPDIIEKIVHPDDRAMVYERVASGYEGVYLVTGQRKDGTKFIAELQSQQSRMGEQPVRVAAVRDVTERETTLALLRSSERRFRDLADAVFDATVLSREGIVVSARGRLIYDLGYDPDTLVGKDVLRMIAPSNVPLTREQISAQKTGSYQSMLVDKEGDPVPVEITAIYSDENGHLTRVAGVRDLRDVRRKEIERQQLQERVERAQRLDSLGVLAGGIAHDFNNLLLSILGNAQCLRSEVTDEEHQEMLDSVLIAARRAGELTKRLLAYTGRGDLGQPERLTLSELIEDLRRVITRAPPDANSAGTLHFVSDLEADCSVMGDRATLTQVLLNLMTNARDAMPTGGEIRVKTRRVTTPDERWDHALGANVGPGQWVQVEIEDTGLGMDESTLSRIFEPFFSTKQTGHGLGLAVCLGIVNSHGGALAVESELNRGTRFSLLLPGAVPARGDGAESSATSKPTPQRWSVLVVDDERLVRDQLERSLRLRGHDVVDADSGIAALAELSENTFDIVLLDVAMPQMDGAEVVATLRERHDRTPVVLMSGYVTPEQEDRLGRAEFQGFLRKPFGVDELLTALARAQQVEVPKASVVGVTPPRPAPDAPER